MFSWTEMFRETLDASMNLANDAVFLKDIDRQTCLRLWLKHSVARPARQPSPVTSIRPHHYEKRQIWRHLSIKNWFVGVHTHTLTIHAV